MTELLQALTAAGFVEIAEHNGIILAHVLDERAAFEAAQSVRPLCHAHGYELQWRSSDLYALRPQD